MVSENMECNYYGEMEPLSVADALHRRDMHQKSRKLRKLQMHISEQVYYCLAEVCSH